ncbi:MAG: efflux RND transporter periplasmic adaptor subunit [Bacteroidales bacterium]
MNKIIYIAFIPFLIGCKQKPDRIIQNAPVKKGEFNVEIVEAGEIKATNAVNISSPALSWRFGQMKITKIIEDGEELSKGDTAIIFDPSEVEKARIDAEANLEIAKAELEKMKAEHDSKIQELESNLKITRIDYEISSILLEQATFEADVTRKEIQLNLDQSKISFDKAKDEIENQKKINREIQLQQLLKIKQYKAELEDAERSLRSLTVASPASGIAILRENWFTGSKWQVGDATWSGNPLIDLPDLRELKVVVEINEVDISKIKLDQPAEIKLDAFSDTAFSGKVTFIASLAKFKKKESKIKIFPVEILICGTSKKLMPGMTVSCKITSDKINDIIYVPLEALHKKDNTEFVYVRSGASYKTRTVVTGLANNDYVIIEKGLTEKDEVALSDPFAKK